MVYEAIATASATVWIQTYIALAFLSGIGYLILRHRWGSAVPLKFYVIHFFIVTWSGLIYLSFITKTLISDYVWYIDWLVSTPLILLALGLTALHESDETRWDLLGALIGLQFMLVFTGLLSQSSGDTTAYWIGNALLLGVFYLLWGPFRTIAEQGSTQLARSYKLLAAYISFFFLLYPTAWYIGTPGPLNILSDYQTSVAFVILPFFCKQVYGFLDLYLIRKTSQ